MNQPDRNRKSWPEIMDLSNAKIIRCLKGIPGARAYNLWELDDYIRRNQPKSVIIQVGSNDLCGPKSVNRITDEIIQSCQTIINISPWLDNIIWCLVIPRIKMANRIKKNNIMKICYC